MSIKVYIHLEIPGYPEKTSKLTIPKGWVTKKPVEEVIKLFLETYNSKNPLEFNLNSEETHLETAADSGLKIYSNLTIGKCISEIRYFSLKRSFMCCR